MEQLDYSPELINKLLLQREKKNAYNNSYQKNLRENETERIREYQRQYMRRSGKANEYYNENKERILARKREQYRLKKLKQKEHDENTITQII
jgi:hypothetical protein